MIILTIIMIILTIIYKAFSETAMIIITTITVLVLVIIISTIIYKAFSKLQ